MCSSLSVFLLFLVTWCGLLNPTVQLQDHRTSSDYIVISDGTEIRIHSRSSQRTSSSLGIRSSAKITSIDYFQASNDSLTIVWIDANGDKIELNTIDLQDTPKVTSSQVIKGQLLSNITSISVLISDPERVVVTSHDDGPGRGGRIVATNLNTRRDCVWVNDGKKPGQVVTTSSHLSYQVIWISNKTCVEGLSTKGVGIKETIVCLPDLKSIPRDRDASLESVTMFDGQLFLILSNGQVFHGKLDSLKNFTEIVYLSDTKMSHGFKNLDLVQEIDGKIEMYVSNKIEGTLNQVILSDEWKALKSNVLAVERSLFDFKIIREKKREEESSSNVACFATEEKTSIEEVIEVVQVMVTSGSDDDGFFIAYSPWWLYFSCLLCVVSVSLVAALFYLHQRNRAQEPRRLIGSNLTSNMEDPIIRISSDKCISIEDLGGFVNPGWNSTAGCSINSTASRSINSTASCSINPCDSCDYKGECAEAGMCLNTFRLLHDHT